MSDRRQLAKEIFLEALELDESERPSYLERECKSDSALRGQVEELIEAHAKAAAFMDSPMVVATTFRSESGQLEEQEVRDVVGDFEIKRELGVGGFGRVYLAERQGDVKQQVAIKILHRGTDAESVIQRFRQERKFLAALNHPYIAHFIDAGESPDGQPFYAMEYVDGQPVDQYCDGKRLSTTDRLRLFQKVCAAVQSAHSKFLLHRDLKPSNILVATDGTPKLLDFGIAKATNPDVWGSQVTAAGERTMTYAYASPEQVRGEPLDVRTDVYSLGVLLYELLTGRPPYELTSRSPLDVQRIICEEIPKKPSWVIEQTIARSKSNRAEGRSSPTDAPAEVAAKRDGDSRSLKRHLAGDLDNVVLYALRKDAERRYSSVQQFVDDIDAYLKHEPLRHARPDSKLYVLRKTARRHRGLLAATAVVVCTMAIGLGVTSQLYRRAERARALEEHQRQVAQASEQKAQLERSKAQRIAEFISGVLGGVGPSMALGRDTTMLKEMLDAAARRLEQGNMAETPETALYLLQTFASTYAEIAEYETAHKLAEQAVSLARSGDDESSLNVASSLVVLGHVVEQRGEYHHAQNLYQEALAIRREALGDRHADVAEVLARLGTVLKRQGEYAHAERLYREALAMRRSLLDEQHPSIADNLDELAGAIRYQTRYDEAEELYRESLALNRQLHGEPHPSVASALSNLARVQYQQSKLVEAEQTFRKSLAMHQELFGDTHPAVADTVNDLADVLEARGRYKEAKEHYRRALKIRRSVFGEEHPDVATSLGNLAFVLSREGAYDEAESLHRRALKISRATLGSQHHYVAIRLKNLADVLTHQKKYQDAERLIRESNALLRELFGEQHDSVATGHISLGLVLQRQGRYEEAEALYRDALTTYREVLGEHHRFVAEAMNSLASAQMLQGKLDEAEASHREALRMRRELLGEQHPYVANSLSSLAALFEARHDYPAATRLYRESLDLRRKILPPDHRDIETNIADLARVLQQNDRSSSD